MGKIRNVIIVLLVVLAVIVILQNTQTVETKLLFVTVTMPRALLLMVTFLVGLAVGFILSGFWFKKPQDQK
ncbi:LapA family protein [Planctomycetota bacterium]